MDTTLLYISLIIYITVMMFAYLFKIKWLYILAGLIWFIPLAEINNMFIMIISITMLIAHFMLGLTSNDDSDF